MQQYINDFQKLLRKENIYPTNKFLKETLYKFVFIYYPNINHVEEGVKQHKNNS